jgi:hypothetical protein
MILEDKIHRLILSIFIFYLVNNCAVFELPEHSLDELFSVNITENKASNIIAFPKQQLKKG